MLVPEGSVRLREQKTEYLYAVVFCGWCPTRVSRVSKKKLCTPNDYWQRERRRLGLQRRINLQCNGHHFRCHSVQPTNSLWGEWWWWSCHYSLLLWINSSLSLIANSQWELLTSQTAPRIQWTRRNVLDVPQKPPPLSTGFTTKETFYSTLPHSCTHAGGGDSWSLIQFLKPQFLPSLNIMSEIREYGTTIGMEDARE